MSSHVDLDIPLNNSLVLPAELVAQPAHRAVFPAGLQAQHSQRLWNHHPLLVIVRRWDTLEGLETGHGGGAAGSLVRDHATDGAPEHLGGSAEVPWAAASGIVARLLAEEGLVLYCCIDKH